MSDEDFPRFEPNQREENLLERCVSYEQYRELEDAFRSFKETMIVKHNELVDHLAANGSGDGIKERLKVSEVTE